MVRFVLASLLSVAVASPVLAQDYRPAGVPSGIGAARARRAPAPAAPAAVPGSRADTELNSPAARTNLDLPPTEALFDAINRGDFSSAKDAVNRGANLTGRNVLGLTPLELAIDLGRNDISFLLLSLRGAEGYSTASGRRPPPAVDAKGAREAERQARREQAVAARSTGRAAQSSEATRRNARLFAGDGGAPVPQAGFLGFDANR